MGREGMRWGGQGAALRKGQAQACPEAQLPLFPAFTCLCLLGFAGLGTGPPQRVVLSSCRLTNNSCWQFLSSALYNYRFKLDQCSQKREPPLDGRLAHRGPGTLSALVCAGWGPRAPTLQSTTAAGRMPGYSPCFREGDGDPGRASHPPKANQPVVRG